VVAPHLRSVAHQPQGQSVRPAPQIRRRHARVPNSVLLQFG
jgi:hypothetical protein